jgi:hypothetical protein
VQVRVGARLTGDPFTVLIACGTKEHSTQETQSRQRAQRN